ncbi:MAG: membrane protein [Candidatus Latescibacterota bacterium]|jgi:membrane protein
MSVEIEQKLLKIPVVGILVKLLKKVILPGLKGLSLYDLLEIYISGIIKGTFSSRASSVAYSFFVALFPFLLFILNLIPYVPIEGFKTRFLIFIEDLLPAQTSDLFYPVIVDIAENPRGGLLFFVIMLAIFLAANGVNSIFSAFEYSIHVTINRNFFKQYFVALAVSLFLAFLLLLTVGVILYGEYIISTMKDNHFISDDLFWVHILQITVFVSMIYIAIASLYYYGTKEGRMSRFFSIGAMVTTLLFLLTTYFFGVYIDNFSTYNELYGSLGALLIMMLYIWINSNLLLLGFELNVSLRRLKDKIKH